MAITLKQLAHARALAHHRNFREAAVALRLTQPALTRSIQSLERSLGITLFDRLAGGVEPTELGKQLLAKTETILRETGELEREMGLLRGHQTGSLAIAMGPYPACELVPRAVAGCLEQIPDLQCRLLIAPWKDSVQLLIDRECELVVAEKSAATGDARFVTTALGSDPLHFVCRPSHPLVSLRRPTLTQVTTYPLAASRVPARLAPVFAGSPRAGSVDAVTGDFLPAFLVESVAAAIGIVTSSNAVTAVPLVFVERQLQSGELVALDLPRNTLCLDSAVIQLQGRTLSPAAKLFLEELVRVKGDMSARESKLQERFGTRRARATTRH
jgi:DNA-binding transcriptional LysR family regulator